MSVTTAMTTSFKQELLQGLHDLDGHTLKLALIKSGESGTFGAASTNFSNITDSSDEASGTGYSSGGATLGSVAITTSGTTAFVDFADVSFSNSTISASGAMIYNSSASNRAIAVISFGGTVASTAGTFTVTMPTADSSNAIIRLA
tara:strand:- start:284 stop:721 length:438 start_codon:yes stop_codon:yes gene_type:complete